MYSLLDPSRFVVFITGATSGFGAAAARRYVAAGGKVIATGRREDRLLALRDELGHDNCHIIPLDVRDRSAMEAAIASIPAPFDAINIVLANAGLALGLQPAAETDLDDWETMIDTNIKGLVYTVRLLLPGLIARGGGHVVTLGSVAGEFTYPGASVYAASKAMTAEDIAESIFWATSLPEHVNVNKIQLMATTQAIGPFIIHREG
jgi:3-hydroxy acid dehydrogenase/malonic semialdehyde reductase